MERIKCLSTYDNLVKNFQKRNGIGKGNGKFFTNNYLSLEEVRRLIDEERLFYTEHRNSIQFYRKEKNYMQLYVLSNPSEEWEIETISQPLLMEMMYLAGREEPPQAFRQSLAKNQFRKYNQNIQIISQSTIHKDKVAKEAEFFRQFLKEHGFSYRSMEKEDYAEASALWDEVIDPYALKSMGRDEQDELFQNKRGICIKDENGKVCAAGFFQLHNHISNARHIGVCEELKQSGLGAALMLLCAQRAFEQSAVKHISWVAQDNLPSMRIHKRIGKISGRISQQYMKEE